MSLFKNYFCKRFQDVRPCEKTKISFGIVGYEQADRASKLAVAPMNITIPVCDMRKHVKLLLHSKWHKKWDSETNNKLHAVKPLAEPWPSFMNRKADTLITRLCIVHTRFTHLHLLLGEEPPMCSRSIISASVVEVATTDCLWPNLDMAPPLHKITIPLVDLPDALHPPKSASL
ncbi:hypothetical protein AVEN_25343-1 [Araneus ventricosus]|uniref:Uncharacterized protein n=1 Tax=Araneus ventricosus TaxID=182803 RepID=A0A4Y2EF05_ARAVE|nr:hypothetical protein AVEN_25343-1 [Araneus ventricosus]